MEENNKIWGPYLFLQQQGRDLSGLHYNVKNQRVSPYLELQAEDLYGNKNEPDAFLHVDVNPYVRFFSIFDPLLTPDDMGYGEFNGALSDVLLHYLADLDLKTGMCKEDFYIRFFIRDLEHGAFGGLDELAAFTQKEKRVIAWWLLWFYHTADGPGSLEGAAEALLPDCMVYVREGEEFVFYMRQPYNTPEEHKIRFLIRLFLPLSYACTIHWTQTYGVIGYEETTPVENFILA